MSAIDAEALIVEALDPAYQVRMAQYALGGWRFELHDDLRSPWWVAINTTWTRCYGPTLRNVLDKVAEQIKEDAYDRS